MESPSEDTGSHVSTGPGGMGPGSNRLAMDTVHEIADSQFGDGSLLGHPNVLHRAVHSQPVSYDEDIRR